MAEMSNEEVAARIVQVYFKEIARLGYKRRLTLDETINAYYYTLSRLQNKKEEMSKVRKSVLEDEEDIRTESKDELIPTPRE